MFQVATIVGGVLWGGVLVVSGETYQDFGTRPDRSDFRWLYFITFCQCFLIISPEKRKKKRGWKRWRYKRKTEREGREMIEKQKTNVQYIKTRE